jgi:elongation factor 1-beta
MATFSPAVRASWKAHGAKAVAVKPHATVASLLRKHEDKAVSKDLLDSIGEVAGSAPAPAAASAPAKKDDDEMDDMFGDDSDDEMSAAELKKAKEMKIHAAKEAQKKAKKVDRTQCVFEIKPWDAEQNLDDLAAKIKKTEFKGTALTNRPCYHVK